jgi:hypothetical protein
MPFTSRKLTSYACNGGRTIVRRRSMRKGWKRMHRVMRRDSGVAREDI